MILDFKRISENAVKISPQAWYLNQFINGSYNQSVTVPAKFSAGVFTFAFTEQDTTTGILQGKSEEAIRNILSIVAKIDETINSDKLKKLIVESQLYQYLNIKTKPGEVPSVSDQQIAELMTLRNELSKKFILSGISNAILSDVLTTATSEVKMSAFKEVNINSLALMVNAIQKYYSLYARSLSVDELIGYVSNELTSDTGIQFVRTVVSYLSEPGGPSMSARLSYVQNSMHNAIYKEDYIGMKTVIDNLEYEIDDTKNILDINYVEAFYGYVAIMRIVMGGPVSTTKSTETSWKDLVLSQVMSTSEFLPFIPSDLGTVDEKKMSSFIAKRWLLHVMRRCTTHDHGALLQRIDTITDLRKYKRNDTLDQALTQANLTASIAWDSLLDVGAEFKALIEDQNVIFPGLHPTNREKFSKFFFDFLGSYTTYRTPHDNSRFLHEPANLINHKISLPERADVGFEVPDKTADALHTTLIDPKTLDTVQYLRTTEISGYIGDANIAIDKNFLQYAQGYSPIYTSKMKRTSLLSTDMFATLGSIIPLSVLKLKSRVPNRLLQLGNIHIFTSAEAMANGLRIPLNIANYIWRKTESTYIVFPANMELQLSWTADRAPIYEENTTSDVTYIQPFIAPWPFLIQRTIQSGIQFKKNPIMVKGKEIKKSGEREIETPEFDKNKKPLEQNKGKEGPDSEMGVE